MAKEVVAGKKKPGDKMNERLANRRGADIKIHLHVLPRVPVFVSYRQIYTDGRNQVPNPTCLSNSPSPVTHGKL